MAGSGYAASPMIMSHARAIATAGSIESYLDSMEDQGITPGAGKGLLRLWGLKFVLDGGVGGGGVHAPVR